MLHIILVILKTVGILLAVLLLLLLLAVAAVLFVPIRYRLDAEKTGSLEDASIRCCVSWLAGAIAFRAAYQKKKPDFGLRILWINKTFGEEEKEPRSQEKKPDRKRKKKVKDTTKEKPEKQKTSKDQKEQQSVEEPAAEEISQMEEASEPEKKSFFEKISERLKGWKDAARRFVEKLLHLKESFKEKWEKIRSWIDWLRTELPKESIRILKGHLFYLLHHMRPRRMRGWVRFGMEDPAATGQITGALYLLMPVCSGVELQPDFENKILEGKLHVAGHIRICHLAKVGLQIFLDKKLKTCWKEINQLRRK